MPKYTFKCDNGHTVQKYTSSSVTDFPCKACDAIMVRQMPKIQSSDVSETVDKYTGTEWKADQREMVKQRRDEYYWSVEVPRLVNSGTYSIETMLENGWIYIDDKEQVQINTIPPHKR